MAYTVSKTSNRTATPLIGLFVNPVDHYPQWQWLDEFVDAYYDAWPVLTFWQAITRVRLVDPAHPDAPEALRPFLLDGSYNANHRQSLYWPGDRSIDVSTAYAAELLDLLAHELGHHWQHHYTERIASDLGAELLRRLGINRTTNPITAYAEAVQRA